jgi:hypothetical protein
MNKLLLRLSTVILSFGMLGAAACSSCSGVPAEDTSTAPAQQTYTCGRGTHKVGNACVADRLSTNTQGTGTNANTLSTNGNN